MVICGGLSLPLRAQETESIPPSLSVPAAPASNETPGQDDGLYFADVIVRRQPIFEVGSLADLSAPERAEIINRRIASILTRGEANGQVTVQMNPAGYASLRFNNRVLMTVTQQDAEDFGMGVEALANRWAERLTQAIDKPPLAIDVSRRLQTTLQQLRRDVVDGLPAFIGALLVMVITWLVAIAVRYGAFKWAQQTEGDRSTEVLIGRIAYGGVWVGGSIIALSIVGLNFGTLLGALGLTSVAIGFSLKDVLSNYISGVILLSARPFRLGDQVVIESFEGTVTQIQLRATTIRTYDGRVVYIPNQEVFQASITNNTASPRRRSSVMVGIDYNADIATATRIIADTLTGIDGIEKNPPPEVLVQELAASTVNLEARFWVDSRRAEFLTMTSEAARAIKEGLQRQHIELPTEIYTLVFRNTSQVEKSS